MKSSRRVEKKKKLVDMHGKKKIGRSDASFARKKGERKRGFCGKLWIYTKKIGRTRGDLVLGDGDCGGGAGKKREDER